MSLEDSPAVEVFKEGLSAKLPDPGRRRRQVRVVIVGLLLLALVLGAIQVFNSPVGVVLRGTGQVQGRVVDDRDRPIPAEIFVLGTQHSTRCDANGEFMLSGVPAGTLAVVATYNGQGIEQVVQLEVGAALNLGELRVAATALPPP